MSEMTQHSVTLTWRSRGIGLLFNLWLIVAFGMTCLAVGHGIGPIGLIMISGVGFFWEFGSFGPFWGHAMTLGWVGIATLIATCLIPFRFVYAFVIIAGISTLAVSTGVFVYKSEVRVIGLASAMPFMGCVVGRLGYLYYQVKDR